MLSTVPAYPAAHSYSTPTYAHILLYPHSLSGEVGRAARSSIPLLSSQLPYQTHRSFTRSSLAPVVIAFFVSFSNALSFLHPCLPFPIPTPIFPLLRPLLPCPFEEGDSLSHIARSNQKRKPRVANTCRNEAVHHHQCASSAQPSVLSFCTPKCPCTRTRPHR